MKRKSPPQLLLFSYLCHMTKTINIVIVDDHSLFRAGIKRMIQSFRTADVENTNPTYKVIWEAKNGLDFIKKMSSENEPIDLIILDIHMPGMNGFDTLKWIKQNHSDLKVLMLSMLSTQQTIIECLKLGAKGFITKDTNLEDFVTALDDVSRGRYHYDQYVLSKMTEIVKESTSEKKDDIKSLTSREIEFIKLCCTEATYVEIAQIMKVSPKTIDGYREALFTRFGFKNRVGLVMFAINNAIIKPQSDE